MHNARKGQTAAYKLAFTNLLFLSLTCAQAQTTTTVPLPKLGPGDPLPQIDLDYSNGSLSTEISPQGVTRFVATGGVTLTYGDLRIQADKITYTRDGQFIEATGNVAVTRGDESLRGDRFTLFGTEGALDSERTVIVSPPLYIASDRFIRGANGAVIQNGKIVSSPDGKGEIALSAREIQIQTDKNRAVLRDTTIRLFGTRLLTVRHVRIPIGSNSREGEREQSRVALPLTFRVSGVAGAVIGLRLPVVAGDRYSGEYGLEFAQRTAPQYFARIRRDLIQSESIGRERSQSSFFALPGGMGNPSYEGLSPIRQLAIARPLPPTPDPILDYETILLSQDPLERPVQSLNRSLFIEASTSGNRDINNKRQGPLLLSQIPEIRVRGSFPLVGKVPRSASNASLRHFLQRPHLQVIAEGSVGQYREQRLQNDQKTVNSGRTGTSFGIGTLPLLVGEHILVRPEMTANYFHYSASGSPVYRYIESRVALDYLFYARTMIGGSYIRRDQSGFTPFTFDEVDTKDEGQVRAQLALPGGKFTLAGQVRYDLRQSRLFDTEIAFAWRGKTIEPRLSYRTQNKQIGFGVTLPGFLP